MSAASAWIMSILGIVIVGTLLDLILPSGRMHKYIKSVFATITVLVIVLPLPSLIKNNFRFKEGQLFYSDISLDEGYLSYAEQLKLSYLEKGVEEQLQSEGLQGVEIRIVGKIVGADINIILVEINLSKLVIDEKLMHINKYELVKELTAKFLNIEKGIITVYE